MCRGWIKECRRPVVAYLVGWIMACHATVSAVAAEASSPCRPAGPMLRIRELQELSGIAASRREPGRLWALKDSGEPVIFALDATGKIVERLTLSGATVEDWEALAVGPCPAGSCIYVGDIGDNDANRRRITIYRVPERGAHGGAVVPEVFHATYPDRPQDAEALLVTPEGRLFLVTKGESGPVALYAFPTDLRAGGTGRLEQVGPARPEDGGDARKVTDAALSPDGRWVVLRGADALSFHRAAEFFAGVWREARRVGVEALAEPQGEGVTFADGHTLYLAGEGGGESKPGTLAQFICAPAPD